MDKVDDIKVETWLQLRNRNMSLAIKCMFGCEFVKNKVDLKVIPNMP